MSDSNQSVDLLFKRSTYEDLGLNLKTEKSRLESSGFSLKIVECDAPEEVLGKLKDAVGIITWHTTLEFSDKVIASLDKCKVLGTYSFGVDHIDVSSATKNGIVVVNVPTSPEVADHALALILALQRKVYQYSQSVKQGNWNEAVGKPIFRINSRVLGLLGFGEIARKVSRKAGDLEFNVISHDPYISDNVFSRHGAESVEFDTLLERSDIISLHLPLTQETRGIIGSKELEKMKKTAFIVNTSRGGVLDEAALYHALDRDQIAGAGLDVMDSEPPDPKNPLLKLDNVLITPHIGWYTEEACGDYKESLINGVLSALQGQEPENLVNEDIF